MFEIVTGILVTVSSGIGLYYWQRRFVDWMSVKRIKSSTDKLVISLLELYEKHFPEDDGTNYTMEEVAEFMDAEFEDDHHVEVENIILAAVQKNVVVGFVFCHLYPKK